MALNCTNRMFLNFGKRCVLLCTSKVDNIKKFITKLILKYSPLKLKLRVFLAGCTVAMVTYCVMKMITCSPTTTQYFDTMIVASSDKEGI